MTDGMQCVLEVLRDEVNRRDIPLSEWQSALRVAEQENILPYFAAKFRQSGVIAPDAILDKLANTESNAAQASFWWTCELRGILQAFAGKAIPVLPLKGPVLAERLYGDISHRVSRDLDLLVHPWDMGTACMLLQKLGFVERAKSQNAYHSGWRRRGTLVELHHDVADPADFKFDTAGAWQRAAQIHFLGEPVWQFAPQDELLFLCIHAAKHCYERLNLVLDNTLAFKHLAPQIDPKSYECESGERLHHLLVLGMAMSAHLDTQSNPVSYVTESSTTLVRMQKLANKTWLALIDGRSRGLGLWNTQHFYLEIEPTLARRTRRWTQTVFLFVIRLTRADFDLAAQFGMKHPAAVWVLRQLRFFILLCRKSLDSGNANAVHQNRS